MISNLAVKKIDYKVAMDAVVNKHYMHRKCPCSVAIGLYKKNKLVGVITFGKPASYTLCNGICGEEESKNVIELNRMWVDDEMPRNTGSWFLSKAMGMCDFEIIVSFADTEAGHTGYIYQASNWIYCGESKRQKYFKLKEHHKECGGELYRRRARMSKAKIIKDYGEEFVEEYYSSLKHRYVYFNCTKKRKKQLIGKLRYEILQYPKQQKTQKTQGV